MHSSVNHVGEMTYPVYLATTLAYTIANMKMMFAIHGFSVQVK